MARPSGWPMSGRHTGRTDLPLLPRGRAPGRGPAEAPLTGLLWPLPRSFAARSRAPARLPSSPGLAPVRFDDDLREWNYGEDEGLTTAQILAKRPQWRFWDEGCPGGEVASSGRRERCDRVLTRLRTDGSAGPSGRGTGGRDRPRGHLLRVLIARWLGLPPGAGRCWVLAPASISRLAHEHGQAVIVGLNRSTP